MKKFGNFYYYLYLEHFFYNMYISELRIKNKVIFNYHYLLKMEAIYEKSFNKMFNNLMKSSKNNPIALEPTFSYGGQFFAKSSFFKDVMLSNDMDGHMLFRNNVKNQTGKNFFLLKYNDKDVELLNEFFKKDDYKSFVVLKKDLNVSNDFVFLDSLEYILAYNLSSLSYVEIYKILVILYLTKIN